ncbi:MAG TPA: hypothetical protein VK157_09695 [Phycisphaerales bacterium]|nr:hypothetical protein [Phycisphaerales bacterium]
MFGMNTGMNSNTNFGGFGPWNAMPNGWNGPQNVNPWLVLAWLNQFNPYAQAFNGQQGWNGQMPQFGPTMNPQNGPQIGPTQFSWNAFWSNNQQTNPGNMPMGQPGMNSQGFFGTNFFNPPTQSNPWNNGPGTFATNQTNPMPGTNQPASNNPMNAYPQYPGVPSFFTATPNVPITPTNPLDEHVPPKRTARNGV